MLGYAANIPLNDRWAIVAYLRALQMAQETTLKNVPSDERDQLEKPPQP